jgi:hypothetical protein
LGTPVLRRAFRRQLWRFDEPRRTDYFQLERDHSIADQRRHARQLYADGRGHQFGLALSFNRQGWQRQGHSPCHAGARNAGFPVYVIGIGPSTGNLDSMAQAGGTGKYYPATSAQELTDALAQISRIVSTCTFNSTTAPPDPTQVYVYVDKTQINQDPTNGWTYGSDSTSFVLTGSYCDAIMSGAQSVVQIIFGCPGYIPPDIIP